MQRLKMFLAKKKIRFFMSPEDNSINLLNITRRAIKMGATELKDASETPDLGKKCFI